MDLSGSPAPSNSSGRLRVAVTGASGYVGRALCRRLLGHPWVDLVVGLDRAAWPDPDFLGDPRFEFYQSDINDPDLADRLIGLDAVCHLAFVLDAQVPDRTAHRVDVEGSQALVRVVEELGLSRLVVASSVSAYGALADNPPRITEKQPLRARPGFRYAFHKVLVERLLDGLEERQPDCAVVRLRICTVLGPPPRPGTADSLLRAPILPMPPSFRVQFVHLDDVVEAFVLALQAQARGPYNVAAREPLSGREICQISGQHYLPLPASLLDLGARALGFGPWPDPGRLSFIAHSIVVDPGRIERELGWLPRHDARAALGALFS
jgi:UDP-glucose 4-epimerase